MVVAPAIGPAVCGCCCCFDVVVVVVVVPSGLAIIVPEPSVGAVVVGVVMVETTGGFFAILCQLGIAMAAPTAITITIMSRPLATRLGEVLMMGLSSDVVVIFFTDLEWISHVCRFTASCTF